MAKNKFPTENDRLLKVSQVAAWFGVSESTIYKWVKAGHFPKPVVLGDPDNPHGAMRYVKREIDEWLEARPRQKEDRDIFVEGPRGR